MDDTELDKTWHAYVRSRDTELKNQLILHYLPLVKSTASRLAMHLPNHISLDDLISSGIFGLVSSIEKFNPDAGFQFKSFALLRIQGAMLDELRQLDWVPRTVRAKAKKLQEAYNAVQQKTGRFATDEEIADYLGITMAEFNRLVETTRSIHLVSLDARIRHGGYDDSSRFSELIADQNAAMPDEILSLKEYKEILTRSIMQLSRREIIVLTLYYFEDLTLKEIGAVIGVTESRVSQIHSKALYRLRSRLNLSEVADYASY